MTHLLQLTDWLHLRLLLAPHRHLVLHLVHVADVSPGQLRAAEDVPGEGALATPLPRDE